MKRQSFVNSFRTVLDLRILCGLSVVFIAACAPTGNGNENVNDNEIVGNDNAVSNDNVNDNVEPECVAEAECDLGFNCSEGACVATESSDIELGDETPYLRTPEGGNMIVRRGFQGGNHIFMSVKTVGFTPGAAVSFTRGVQPDGTTLPLVINSTVTQFLEAQVDGTQLLQQVFVFIDGVIPQNYDGLPATVTMTITEQANPAITATLTQRVILTAEP